jgi:hypothetical protein
MLPNLPIYRSMPGPFRELWLELVSAGETIVDNAERDKDLRRRAFVEGVFASKSLEIEKSNRRDAADQAQELVKSRPSNRSDKSVFSDLAKQYTETVMLSRNYLEMLDKRKSLPVYSYKGLRFRC